MTDATLRGRLLEGLFIPAHPLALDAEGRFDERSQRALTRYYVDAGAGGLAVGVHTTQFEIRRAGLYAAVLELAATTAFDWSGAAATPVLVAGVVGDTDQAIAEARIAHDLGYDALLVSLAGLDWPDARLVEHCARISEVLPIVGFYLQPAVGGRRLALSFWRELMAVERLAAIKVSPFDRYATLDVLRAVAESGRAEEVALYTGNDDAILHDLLTTWRYDPDHIGGMPLHFHGGLLGHWAVWTARSVEIFEAIRTARRAGVIPTALLSLAPDITDANAAFFDAAHGFRGSIAGINEMLRRAGLLRSARCLDERERLSPGQLEEIDRVVARYPHLSDDVFVREHRERWLS